LKTVATQYSGNLNPLVPDVPTAYNVVPAQATTTWPDGHNIRTVNTWDSGTSITIGGQTLTVLLGSLLQHDEYDFSNTLVRSTVNHYLWQDSATYKNSNFLGLKTSVTLKNGAGTQVAQTTYTYDQGSVASSGIGVPTHVAPPAGEPIRGNLTTTSRWLNTNNSFISSTATYFDTGMLASGTDPLGHVTSHTYSSTFLGAYVTQTNMPDTGSPAVHHVIGGNYDFNTGLLTSFTDENSHTFTYQYDNMLRLAQGNHPDGGQPLFTYPDRVTIQRQRLLTAAVYDTFIAKFDGLGRSIQSQAVTPECATNVKATLTYDVAGRTAAASNPYCQTNESTYGNTQNQYDALGRVTRTTKADGSFSTASYTGTCVVTTDEAGKSRK